MSRIAAIVVLLCVSVCLLAQMPAASIPAQTPNSDSTYRQLRTVGMSGESLALNNFVLKRDAGTFTLTGVVCFVAAVNGKVTGAVFNGTGSFTIHPPIPAESQTLRMLTKSDKFSEEFSEMVMRFTDGSYDELKKAGSGSSACNASQFEDSQNTFRKHLHENISARILEDVLGSQPGGLFVALIKGKHYSGKMVYVVDPRGAMEQVAPEEVALFTWDESKSGIWAAFHLSPEYQSGKATGTQDNQSVRVAHQTLDTHIEKSGKLVGDAQTTFVAAVDGVRVVPFNLFPTLRVTSVSGEKGEPLAFIQEDKDDDPDFAVILPRTLAAGEKVTIRTKYSGKDAVRDEGGGNYYPVARTNWYPNSWLSSYATYDMSFYVPKGLSLVASGTLLRSLNEGNEAMTVWKTEVPQEVAGFNLGKFRKKEVTAQVANYQVQSFANEELPGDFTALKNAAEGVMPSMNHMGGSTLGSMSTTALMDKPLGEAHVAIDLYTNYFGPAPYKHISMTQQTACNYGQSWPALVYLPICSYFDTTVQHQLGLDDPRGYWKVVAAHEVAHQWWGHTVGWSSYRDQWMSEGFSEFSASLFVQSVYGNKELQKFWNDERDLLTESNRWGWRGIDAGPVTIGYRASNSRTGGVARNLIYPKGGYILHMIRMMMWDPKTGDHNFQEAMKDYVRTFQNRPASTEDFKAVLERHMLPVMNATSDGKLDWFFNEYVYGTALPAYKFDFKIENSTSGSPALKMSCEQSNVDENFRMPVPVYLEWADGRVSRLGSLLMVGNSKKDFEVSLNGVKQLPRRALLNYFADVLAAK